jgi:hypothetical protein
MTEDPPPGAAPLSLAAGFKQSGVGVDTMWLEYCTMGGTATRAQMISALMGDTRLDRYEHNKLAAALNELSVDAGNDHPVGYRDEPDPQ